MKNILVVNVNWMGDVILSTPVFKNLRQAFPQARICCLAVPRVAAVLRAVPQIDEVLRLKEGPLAFLGMIFTLKKHRFDAAFFLSKSRSRVLLAKWAGIPQRIGYAKSSRNFLTHVVPKADLKTTHRRDIYLKVIESFGVPVTDRKTALEVKDHSFTEGKGCLLVHVGANWNLKQWPLVNFARLIQRLNQPVGIIGSTSEHALVEKLRQLLPKDALIEDFVGRTTVPELFALLKNAKALITADSGPMHAASSVGTPVIALFGPTKDTLTGPCGTGKSMILRYDVGCNRGPCYHLSCPDNICMQAVTVEDVLDAVKKIENT